MALLDSGERRIFETGAQRDISEDKGRLDLIALHETASLMKSMGLIAESTLVEFVAKYMDEGNIAFIYEAVKYFIDVEYESCISTAMIELSKQYQEGAKKYSDRNWEKGMPTHCFVDSGLRHYFKYLRGDVDEPHSRAVLWNFLGLIWMTNNHPELMDNEFRLAKKGG